MTIRLYEDRDRKAWDDYVKRVPAATHYHQIGWKEVIERSFGQHARYWLAQDELGEIQGVLPLIHLNSVLFGSFMVSLPYLNYGGILAGDDRARTALLEAAVERAGRDKVRHIELRQEQPMRFDLPFKTGKVSMRLTLPSLADELWKGLDSKLRSQIRRPMKEGLVSRIGRMEELDGFYEVFSRNMRDLGTPVYSKFFFRNILTAFPDSTWICTVYRDATPVASGFLVGFKEILEIPWASSLRKYNAQSPNMLLYWAALQFACERGFKVFDFGRSTPGGGAYKFKEQWGAKPVPLYWYYWMRNGGPLPELNPSNPKYRSAIALWKRLPVGLTRVLGPYIVRNLP
jgi:serine/alanine adding enzyme